MSDTRPVRDTTRVGSPPGAAASSPSALALAAWLEQGRRGVVDVQGPGGACRLHLGDGALRLGVESPAGRGADTPLADLEPLIVTLGLANAEHLRFTPSTVMTPQGRPLPTARLLMEAAVRGRDRAALWNQIGGRAAVLRMAGESALSQEALAGIEPRLQALLARFVRARRAGDMASDEADENETLRDIARLRAVGLLAVVGGESEGDATAVSGRSKELFLRRIGRELERRPLRLDTEAHRARIFDLLRNLGIWNHYELLRVGRHQDEQAIHQAYVEVASLAHPSHAAKLHLEGREAALDLLFEAATEAYLVLSHPDRRRDYDRDLGADLGGPASQERRREKAGVARDMYLRARRMSLEQEFQPVLELMQQAVQLDPQAEYYKLLGDVQRRNPQWRAAALASYRDAVRCRPDDAGLRFAFAEALEDGGDRTQAGIQYRAALELSPYDEKLQNAVDAFENAGKGKRRGATRGGDKAQEASRKSGDADAGDGGGLFPTFRKLFRRGRPDKGKKRP